MIVDDADRLHPGVPMTGPAKSAKNCASADKLGDDAGDGFGLLPSHRQ
jgi:hypothetical protein